MNAVCMAYDVELFGAHAFPTPKGLWPPAQGCEARATLGGQSWNGFNPERVVLLPWCITSENKLGHNPFRVAALLATISQGSSFLATLGFEAESLWDSSSLPRSKNAFRVRFGTLPSS